jgi:hypothetical protein
MQGEVEGCEEANFTSQMIFDVTSHHGGRSKVHEGRAFLETAKIIENIDPAMEIMHIISTYFRVLHNVQDNCGLNLCRPAFGGILAPAIV